MLLAFALVPASAAQTQSTSPAIRWTMLNVCGPIGQADCHLLTLPDGRNVLVDAADAGDASATALAHLRRYGVTHLALVVISHFHADHYGRLIHLIESGISVDRVIVSIPGHRRIADREMPWGCNFDHVLATLARLTDYGIPYAVPAAGERLLEFTTSDGTTGELEVICAYDGINTPIGETDINDTSILVRVRIGNTRALFTGDLNYSLGAYLARSGPDIGCDLLKVPHHGTEGVAPNAFFDRVGASTVLVPSPKALWFSERSRRVRDYFASVETPAYVSGLHGNVTAILTSDGYRIETESAPAGAITAAPAIVAQPKSSVARRGAAVTLSVNAGDDPALTYQWRKDGAVIEGATSSTLTLPDAQETHAGVYRVQVSNARGLAMSAPARVLIEPTVAGLPPAKLINLSVRSWVGRGDSQAILGFSLEGPGTKRVLVRAIGPTLTTFGVQGVLAAPRLTLTTLPGSLIAANDDWDAGDGAAMMSEVFGAHGAFALAAGSGDAALIATLPSGSYTVLIDDTDGASGIALGEVYDLEPDSPTRLVNLSGRALVRDGDGALIAGYVVRGDNPTGILVRGIGPTLRNFGVGDALLRPRLSIHRMDGMAMASSASWSRSVDADALCWAFARCGAFPIERGGSDVATLLYHSGGMHTATIQSEPGSSGIALVELYALP